MDSFSERFAAALIQAIPAWTDLVQASSGDESLDLCLESPAGGRFLSISTEGEEVTVGFGPWHAHYQAEHDWLLIDAQGNPTDEPFERITELVKNLLLDRIVIQVWTEAGRYRASGPYHRWYGDHRCAHCSPGDHYYLMSWSGMSDQPSTPIQ